MVVVLMMMMLMKGTFNDPYFALERKNISKQITYFKMDVILLISSEFSLVVGPFKF